MGRRSATPPEATLVGETADRHVGRVVFVMTRLRPLRMSCRLPVVGVTWCRRHHRERDVSVAQTAAAAHVAMVTVTRAGHHVR